MKTFYFVRHGQTDWNLQRKLQGHSDIPLNATGLEQAAKLMKYFKEIHLDRLYSSDLSRALQTAKLISESLKIPIQKDSRFREAHLGDMEGKTKIQIIEEYGLEVWDNWANHTPQFYNYKWPNSESKKQVLFRLGEALDEIIASSEKNIAVVSHGLLIRTLIHHINQNLTEPAPIPNCVVYKVLYSQEKGLHLPEIVFSVEN